MTTAKQQPFHRSAPGGQYAFQSGAGEELIAMAMPLLEQPLRLFQQISPQLFRGGRSGVDQVLEVAHQRGPTLWQPVQPPVHLGPVAADHVRKLVRLQFVQYGGRARRTR